MRGLFISLEGLDGSGKTSQCKLLKKYLDKKNVPSLIVREPGSTPIGEKIRKIIIDKNNAEMSANTEALLYAAARAQLVEEEIEPALLAGKMVICDRFLDSSLVYQGVARGLGIDVIQNINSIATNGIMPDITFFIDLPPHISFVRKNRRAELDRIEQEHEDFHNMVYDGYQKIINENTSRIRKIDGTLTKNQIHRDIISVIEAYFLFM